MSLITTQPYFKEVEWSNWFHHLIILKQISKRYKTILTLLHNIIMPTLGPSLLPSQRMWIVMLCFSPCQRSLAIHELALGNICSTFLCSTFFCIQKLKKSAIKFLLYLIPSPHYIFHNVGICVVGYRGSIWFPRHGSSTQFDSTSGKIGVISLQENWSFGLFGFLVLVIDNLVVQRVEK